MEMKQVYSGHVSAVGHDPETNELHVAWDNGKRSVYSGVPAEVAEDGLKQYSVGKWLHQMVKPVYKHRYL